MKLFQVVYDDDNDIYHFDLYQDNYDIGRRNNMLVTDTDINFFF